MMDKKVLYFGVGKAKDSRGHYLMDRNEHAARDLWRWIEYLDGLLAPSTTSAEGVAALHYVRGYTILAWWDRSGDSRPGSNSMILVPGMVDFDTAVNQAKDAFPWVFNRMRVQLTRNEPQQRVWIVWGSRMSIQDTKQDAIREYAFDTPAEMNAFLLGVSECDGWQEFHQANTREEAEAYVREITVEGEKHVG